MPPSELVMVHRDITADHALKTSDGSTPFDVGQAETQCCSDLCFPYMCRCACIGTYASQQARVGSLTICYDARHLGGCKLSCLLAFVAVKNTYQAAVHLIFTTMCWLEVRNGYVPILLIVPFACTTDRCSQHCARDIVLSVTALITQILSHSGHLHSMSTFCSSSIDIHMLQHLYSCMSCHRPAADALSLHSFNVCQACRGNVTHSALEH